MTLRDAVAMAVSGLRGNVVRTLLTTLGLAVGVGAVLTVLTLGDAGEVRVEDEIAKLGVNKVWIRVKDNQASSLSLNDSKLLWQKTGAPACASAYTLTQIVSDGRQILTQAAGFDRQFDQVYSPTILEGRVFSETDFVQSSPVCLLDEILAEQLGGGIIGERITVAQRRLRVIGVVKGMTTQTMAAGDGLIIMPITTYMDTFGGDIAEITLSVQRGQDANTVADIALTSLEGADSFRADSLENEISAAREVVRIFVMVLVCVAMVCMLTGGIGVMNVLLLAVRERKREIGVIKAVGGTSKQVCILFLLEACVYSATGGMLGVLIGSVLIHIFSLWIGLKASLDISTVIPVLASGTILGTAFGVVPAMKAARLQPVEALQSE